MVTEGSRIVFPIDVGITATDIECDAWPDDIYPSSWEEAESSILSLFSSSASIPLYRALFIRHRDMAPRKRNNEEAIRWLLDGRPLEDTFSLFPSAAPSVADSPHEYWAMRSIAAYVNDYWKRRTRSTVMNSPFLSFYMQEVAGGAASRDVVRRCRSERRALINQGIEGAVHDFHRLWSLRHLVLLHENGSEESWLYVLPPWLRRRVIFEPLVFSQFLFDRCVVSPEQSRRRTPGSLAWSVDDMVADHEWLLLGKEEW